MVNKPMGLARTRKGRKCDLKITFLLGGGERHGKHSIIFYLADLPQSIRTLFSVAEKNCCITTREPPDPFHTGALRGQGRLPLVCKEPYHNQRDASREFTESEKSPRGWQGFNCDASPARNPIVYGSQASLLAPTQLDFS